jgi:hypothetical protein
MSHIGLLRCFGPENELKIRFICEKNIKKSDVSPVLFFLRKLELTTCRSLYFQIKKIRVHTHGWLEKWVRHKGLTC